MILGVEFLGIACIDLNNINQFLSFTHNQTRKLWLLLENCKTIKCKVPFFFLFLLVHVLYDNVIT